MKLKGKRKGSTIPFEFFHFPSMDLELTGSEEEKILRSLVIREIIVRFMKFKV